MRLPFALDHINLWLLDDGPTWTVVDTGFALPETKAAWQRIFAEVLGGRRVGRVIVTHYHPDHIGLAGWLTEHWAAPLLTTEKEWLHAQLHSRRSGEDAAELRREFAHRAGLDAESAGIFAERQGNYRQGVPSVPAAFRRIAEGSVIRIASRSEVAGVAGRRAAVTGPPPLTCLRAAATRSASASSAWRSVPKTCTTYRSRRRRDDLVDALGNPCSGHPSTGW